MVAHHLVHLNSHLEVYIVWHTHRAGKKNTVSVSTNSNVSFCGTYGCSNLSLSSRRWVLGKWMSKNPNVKPNDDDDDEDEDEDEDDDDDDETLRRGCCVKRRTRHVTRVHLGEGAWNWTFRAERRYLDPKREHPTMSMVAHHLVHLNSHLEVYIVRHTHRAGKKNTVSVSTNPKVAFAVPMDARTCHFHRTVGYGANGCRKIRMSSRMMTRMRMMTMMLMMRHCEGAAAWRDAQGMWREFTWGGGMELDIHSHSWTKISGFEKRAPHDCHGWSSLSLFKEPFGGILSDTRIVRGNKTRSVLAQTPMSLFAVPMDARTCHFHRTVGYLENACRKIRMSSRMMMVMRRRMMMMLMMMMVMMTRHCEGPAAWRDSPGIWREFPLRGREGGGSDCRCDVTPAWVVHEPWTGMKLDIHSHSWTKISGFEKRAPHDCHGWSSLSLFGGILSDTRIVRGKKTRSVLAQTPKSLLRYLWMLEPVTFIAPLGTGQMDVEKSECQVEWWWWWWWWGWGWGWGWWRWCWWWDTAKGLLREETHKACDESSLGEGAWNWTFRAERRYLDPKREHPTMSMVAHHLVHLNSHLEVYIVRHTHRAGKKTRSVLAQTPMSLFAVPMDARTCHFHRAVGYLENGCLKIRMSSRMMMVMRMMMMMAMMTRHCEGAAAWRDSPGIWREFPLRGEGGSLSPGRSRIRGPARPFASQSKTQGSPLGGHLSWHNLTISHFTTVGGPPGAKATGTTGSKLGSGLTRGNTE